MGDLTKHFSKKEFACHCGCGFDKIDIRLVQKLEELREMLGKPIKINCGCRCEAHNIAVNGVKNSQHLCGHAADIRVDGVPPRLVAAAAEKVGFGGIGTYRTFVHVDVRNGRARWRGC